MDRRGALMLGAGAALGGLPVMRPDQQYFPPPSGIVPGPRQGNVIARRVIIVGANGALLAYSPTQGAGNLIEAISPLGGSDQFGNVFLPGFFQIKQGAPATAIQLNAGQLAYYTAATEAGPYTSRGTLALDGANSLEISTFTSVIFNVLVNAQAGLVVIGGLTTDTLSVTGTIGAPVTISGPIATALAVISTLGGGATPVETITSQATGDSLLGMKVAGDTNQRILFDTTVAGNAELLFGTGAASPDCRFRRSAANTMSLLTADLNIGTVGRGLQIKTGTNAKMGTAVLVGGTVTVADTSVTANSFIVAFGMPGAFVGTAGELTVTTITAGTSFVITSASNTDTRTVGYLIIEGT